jgi:GT2 family glycosyltransferase
MDLDILIISRGAKEVLSETLRTLALYSVPGYRLTVYDNNKRYPDAWTINRFMEKSKRGIVALVEPDVFLYEGWDSEALDCFEENKDCGIASPLTNHPAHSRTVNVPNPGDDWVKQIEEAKARSCISFGSTRFLMSTDVEKAPGCCTLIRKSVWEEVDGFDEGMTFPSQYEFNHKAIKEGYSIGVCLHSVVLHRWSQTIREKAHYGTSGKSAEPPEELV